MHARKRRILKPRIHEFHRAKTAKVLRSKRYQQLPGLDCHHAKSPIDEATCQLAGTAPDLKHRVAPPDVGNLTRNSDQLVRVARTAVVILRRNLIEHSAEAPR
jgi:hypothetical protein